MKIIILAPIYNSIYSLTTTELVRAIPGVEEVAVVCRKHVSLNRFKNEFKRDGAGLIKKAITKVVLKTDHEESPKKSLVNVLKERGVNKFDLRYYCKLNDIKFHSTENFHAKNTLNFIEQFNPTVILFTGGGLIRQSLLESAKYGVINVHMGILPFYKGMDVVEWPFLIMDRKICDEMPLRLGLTVHQMDKGVDTGPVFFEEEQPISKDSDFNSIRSELLYRAPYLYEKLIKDIIQKDIKPIAQNRSLGSQFYVIHPRLLKMADKNFMNRVKNFK